MKKLIIIALALLISISFALPVLAAGTPRLVDNADILTASEEQTLLSRLNEISERQRVDIVVVTVNSLGGKSSRVYADDFYDQNGYGFGTSHDGVLLLISMEARDFYISTSGYGITAITDAGLEYVEDRILSDISAGRYAQAFTTYATTCDDLITRARSGNPYDVEKGSFSPLKTLVIAVIIGIIAAAIVTSILKGQLKSVRRQTAANNYIKQNSMKITVNHDRFLYKNVSRRAKPQNNTSSGGSSGGSSTHRSSSGRSHGGRGGKF